MARQARQIFFNQTTNGNSDIFGANGKTYVKISGNFDGATIDFQSKTNNSSDDFTSTGDTAISATGQIAVNYSPGMQYRLALSGVGASTSINAFVTV
jgi:hypothetical protein